VSSVNVIAFITRLAGQGLRKPTETSTRGDD
jgi:hypothetical protein